MTSGFQPFAEVRSSDNLFGRCEDGGLLSSMLRQIGLGTNYHVYGERRAGKSSLLHCCKTQLELHMPRLLPIYLNFRLHNAIVGGTQVQRFIIANILTALHGRGVYAFDTDRFHCQLTSLWEPIYEALLEKADHTITGLLTGCVDQIQHRGYGVVLLIDEYEHLMIHSFANEPGAFFPIRDLSARGYVTGAPKPLTFVMAGAELWQDICEVIGSPELNTAITSFDVGPISFEAFGAMWSHCLGQSDIGSQEVILKQRLSIEEIYAITGGWPFYGKLFGHHALSGRFTEDDFDDLIRPYFDVVWRRLGRFRSLVVKAEQGTLERSPDTMQLLRRGLLMEDTDGLLVPRGFAWARYVREHASDINESVNTSASLLIARRRLLTRLGEVQRIVYADDWERQRTAESFRLLDDWTESCTNIPQLQAALTELTDIQHREASVVIDLASRMR